jgi:hypothetical protein
LAEEKFGCSGCSRGCTIKILQEGGKIYLDGNKCIGGEQQIRLSRPEFADKEFFKTADKETKKGFWKRLFSIKRQ